MFRRQRREIGTLVAEVLGEAIAILEGRFCELGSRSAPGWVRINQLAHATWSDLQLVAETCTYGGAWEGAVSYLASEIRTQTESATGLLALQRNRLIPLELEVLAGWTTPPQTPLELVSLVRAEVDRIRRFTQHPSQQQV
jgi:hypothetical protein